MDAISSKWEWEAIATSNSKEAGFFFLTFEANSAEALKMLEEATKPLLSNGRAQAQRAH